MQASQVPLSMRYQVPFASYLPLSAPSLFICCNPLTDPRPIHLQEATCLCPYGELQVNMRDIVACRYLHVMPFVSHRRSKVERPVHNFGVKGNCGHDQTCEVESNLEPPNALVMSEIDEFVTHQRPFKVH